MSPRGGLANKTQQQQRIDADTKRQAVKFALEITIESLRSRIAQAMNNEPLLDQLYGAIQPDGTIHL